MWDAFEAQQAKTPRSNRMLNNPRMLGIIAGKHFRTADFTNSGKIDKDEVMECLATLAEEGGFEMPDQEKAAALLRAHAHSINGVKLEEFVQFVKAVASGEAHAEVLKSPPPALVPMAPTPHTEPTPAAPTPLAPTPVIRPSPALTPAPLTNATLRTGGSAVRPSPQPLALALDGTANLRVSVIEAQGLPACRSGSGGWPYATVAVIDLTRRRSRRTAAASQQGSSASDVVTWGEAFDFPGVTAEATVVVDVWDPPSDDAGVSSRAELLGKVVVSLSECRPGIPHMHVAPLLLCGHVVLRVLLDHGPLPSAADEEAAYGM